MPEPKLSAVLNNCPLHALTPDIKAEVIKFSENIGYNNLHTEHYLLLKKHFATFYKLDPENFSWKDFAEILKNYNAFDTQIILGPVLREFSKEFMSKDPDLFLMALGNGMESEEYIKFATEISVATGRYGSLSPDHLFRYVSQHLGFSLIYQRQNTPEQLAQAVSPISTVRMYHQGGIDGAQAGGHWERTANGAERIDYEISEDTMLPPLLTLLGQDSAVNDYGFSLLKKHVQLMARFVKENIDLTDEFQELVNTSAQINQYLFNIASVPKALAVSLLGDPLTAETREFIAHHVIDEVLKGNIYEVYINAPVDKKPHINAAEAEIIKRLETPIAASRAKVPSVKIIVDEVLNPLDEDSDDDTTLQIEVGLKKDPHKAQEILTVVADPTDQTDESHLVLESDAANAKSKENESLLLGSHIDEEEEADVTSLQIHATTTVLPLKDPIVNQVLELDTADTEKDTHLHIQVEDDANTIPPTDIPVQIKAKPSVTIPVKENAGGKELPGKKNKEIIHETLNPADKVEEVTTDNDEQLEVATDVGQDTKGKASIVTDGTNPPPKKPPEITNRDVKKAGFDAKLDLLKAKVDDLHRRRTEATKNPQTYSKLNAAYNTANDLHLFLLDKGNQYFNRTIDYDTFKNECSREIKNAHAVLNEHRDKGLQRVLRTIADFIKGLGRLFTGKYSFFPSPTESEKKVDDVEEQINQSAPCA